MCGVLVDTTIMARIAKIYIVALDPRELILELSCVTGFPTVYGMVLDVSVSLKEYQLIIKRFNIKHLILIRLSLGRPHWKTLFTRNPLLMIEMSCSLTYTLEVLTKDYWIWRWLRIQYHCHCIKKKFEDTKGVIRSRKLKKGKTIHRNLREIHHYQTIHLMMLDATSNRSSH